jgi:molecular chaperone GrpE
MITKSTQDIHKYHIVQLIHPPLCFPAHQADDLKNNLLRTLADMENLRERTSRQTAEARQFAVQGLVKSLVDVADNLERAAGSVAGTLSTVDGGGPDAEEVDRDHALSLLRSLRDGVLLTDNVLMRVMKEHGVERYDPLGDKFDPNLHNALFEVPDGSKEPGTVAVVVKKGYMLHDRAVRAADVGVVRAE